MKRVNKILSGALAGAVLLSLTACGGSASSGTAVSSSEAASSEAASSEAVSSEAAAGVGRTPRPSSTAAFCASASRTLCWALAIRTL